VFELREIDLFLGHRAILKSVTVKIEPGRFTAIVGPNGAGKSSLLRVLAGELRPRSGAALFEGRPIHAVAAVHLASRRAVLPQSSQLAFPFTVYEVVRLGLDSRPGVSPADRRIAPAKALERVDLAGFGARRYQQLSGGEQQRVHLARVLCQIGEPVEEGRPQYLFLDEPTSSLDIRHQMATLDIARDFAHRGGGVLAILHDLNFAAAFADHVIVIHDGRVFAEGTPAEVINDRLLAEVFGVPLRVGETPPYGTPFVLPRPSREGGRQPSD